MNSFKTSKGVRGKWVAMSYLDDHVIGIPFEKMPRTIQDAVSITRMIGVRYLWVDSLCILQDSNDDWEHESSTMANVYRNSVVTIAANSASDANGSCFLNRNKLANLPCPISLGSVRGKEEIQWIHGCCVEI